MLKYPSMIFGYTTNLLHPLILYSILCVYFCMLFLIHTHSSQSFTLFDGVVGNHIINLKKKKFKKKKFKKKKI